jgi:hypothetical protein
VARVLAVVAVVLIAGACTGSHTTERAARRPPAGAAPLHVSGIYVCPGPEPIVGYRRRFYPVHFPSPPPVTVRPDACFASGAQAVRAGYQRAPVPKGDVLIGGVYLVPADRDLSALCQRAVHAAGLRVPCPALVPDAGSVTCNALTQCAGRGWFVLEGSFAGPTGYVGIPGGGGHLYVIGFAHRKRGWPQNTLAGGRVVGRTRVSGHAARFVAYPFGTSLNSGHVVLEWHVGATTYAVSLHGHTRVNERLDMAIARHLRYLTSG